jgi:hypothetical protein
MAYLGRRVTLHALRLGITNHPPLVCQVTRSAFHSSRVQRPVGDDR